MNKDSYAGTQSVHRAIQLLKLFDDDCPERSLTDLVDETGLNKATVFRILTALESQGLIRRGLDGRYALGSEMIALGGRAMRANQLRKISHEALTALAEETGETATLEILRIDGDGASSMLVIDEVLGRYLVGITQYIGSSLPIHATSTGKALLAFQSPEIKDHILKQTREKLTGRSAVGADNLKTQLAEIRERGYALAMGELEAGVMAVAAPIFDANASAQAAISLVGPSIRINEEKLNAMGERVMEKCAQISYQIGFRPNPKSIELNREKEHDSA